MLTLAPDYEPDLIIIFHYVGNDISDIIYRPNDDPKKPTHGVASEKLRQPKAVKKEAIKLPGNKESKQQSGHANKAPFDWKKFREQGIDSMMIEYAKNRIGKPGAFGPEYVNPHLLVTATWQSDFLFDNNAMSTPGSRYGWYRTLKLYDDIIDYADSEDVPLYIVTIPSTVQVDSSHYDFYRKLTFRVSNERMYPDKPQRMMEIFGEFAGFYHIDLLPTFRAHDSTQSLYFVNDDHLSSKGHALAFEKVRKELFQPYAEGKFNPMKLEYELGYHESFLEGAIAYVVQVMRRDRNWLNSIHQKAQKKGVTLDSMLVLDARHLLESK